MTTIPRPIIAIADKNPVVRSGLLDIIARDGRFELGPAVASGTAFIEAMAKAPADVGVVGWSLPDMSGGEVLEALKRQRCRTALIVYTGEPPMRVLHQAIKAGVRGFLSKSDEPAALIETISAVARGRICLPFVDLESIGRSPLDVLTTRERELLGALANGWSNMQIAARIGISENTVKYHLKNLYDKLEVKNRAMAVALYMSHHGVPEGA